MHNSKYELQGKSPLAGSGDGGYAPCSFQLKGNGIKLALSLEGHQIPQIRPMMKVG